MTAKEAYANAQRSIKELDHIEKQCYELIRYYSDNGYLECKTNFYIPHPVRDRLVEKGYSINYFSNGIDCPKEITIDWSYVG